MSGLASDRSLARVPRERRRYGRWRAASLLTVYVLMVAHLLHWRLAGTTLAPLELNEVMYTLEAGIVTAGFLFMALALVSVVIFGRFFCSWGCHILALEDGSAWLLRQVGIRPRPIRSRLLLLVPPAALFYMFIWPQITRIIESRPAPAWQIMSPDDPWGSFLTNDFWRNLPGPFIAILTFVVCGFLIVYLLGSRSFCTYVCPYGAAFSLADRFAPGRIVHAGGGCDTCGACTAACKSNILVHEEVRVFGRVVSPACLKDLDCVAACPDQSLSFGFARPALFQSWKMTGRKKRRYDVSIGEEVLMASVVLAAVLILRGLYDVIPLLLSLGLGAVLAWISVVAWRLLRPQRVDLSHLTLKQHGKLTGAGRVFVVLVAVLSALLVHSAFIRWHEVAGQAAFDQLRHALGQRDGKMIQAAVSQVIHHLDLCDRWGLVGSMKLDQQMAGAYEWSDTPLAAEPYLRRLIERRPAEPEANLRLAGILVQAQRLDEAAAVLDSLHAAAGSLDAPTARRVRAAHLELARQLARQGREADAAAHVQQAGRHGGP